MIKTGKYITSLEALIERIDDKIADLEYRISEIEGEAEIDGRELTKAEERKIEKIQEQIQELEYESADISSAIDCLSPYME